MNRGIKLSFAMSLGFCALSGASFAILSNSSVSATEITATATANATVSVAEACTMESGSSTDTPHTATIPAGTNKSDIGQTTFKVICNDSAGFSVYAVGYANEELGNTKLLATIGGALNPTYDIETGLNMTNTTSSWAMKLTPVSGTYAPTITTGYTDYHVVPSTNTKVATYAGVTDGGNNANGSAFTATYRANISGSQPAGNYNGKVKYTMVHPANATPNEPKNCGTANRICYWPNAEGVYEGTMGQQYASTNASVTLTASNFSRSGYGFAGWSDAYDYIPNEGSPSNPDAHIYGPNETITTPSSMSNGLSLYAVWVKSQGSLQGWTGCNDLYQGNVTALTDQRDNQTYAVAKLADGKCWMIENLRLESTNSDNSTGLLAQGYGTSATYGNFSGLATAESANFTVNDSNATAATTANSLYYAGTQSSTATIDISQTNYAGYRMPRYNNINTQSRATNPTGTGVNVYSYGNYYTWAAAVADTSYYNTDNQSVTNTSLCPSGWHLPTGGSVTATVNATEDPSTWREFYNLGYGIMGSVASTYDNTITNANGDTANKAFRKYPNNFLYSGNFVTDSVYPGANGYYWSTTTRHSSYAYFLNITSTDVAPGTGSNTKSAGRSIRCVVNS